MRKLMLIMAFVLFAGVAGATVVGVDIDANAGPTESGYLSLPVSGDSGNTVTFTNAFGAGQNLTVAVTNPGVNRTRLRSPIVGGPYLSMSDQLRDFIGMSDVQINLTMPAGTYTFTGWCHDTTVANGVEGTGTWYIGGVSQGTFSQTGGDGSVAGMFLAPFTGTIVSSGSAVLVELISASNNAKFTSFTLDNAPAPPVGAVAEPSALALVALGLLGITRRRK